jgi:hypothetical protein
MQEARLLRVVVEEEAAVDQHGVEQQEGPEAAAAGANPV